MARLRDLLLLDGFIFRQWHTIATDAAALVATWGGQLRQIGWNDLDLVGVNPRVLGRGVQNWELALLINGGPATHRRRCAGLARRRVAHQYWGGLGR